MAKFNETDNTTINLISNGTDITGDIKSNGDIRIDGSLTGNLSTKGKLVLAQQAKLKVKLSAKTQKYQGLLKAKYTVGQLLNLKASSKILGDIVTSKLSIEPGAIFSGNCKMSDTEKNGGTAHQRKTQEKPGEKPGK